MKKNIITILIITITIVLAGVAIYTAIRLYQLRQQSVAPNVPTSKPAAQEASPTPAAATTNNCSLSFTLGASPSPSPTASPTSTPSPTPVPACNDTCTTEADCPSDMTCSSNRCRNLDCVSDSDCVCGTSTPTPTPGGTPTGEVPALPEAGIGTPTVIGAGFGVLLLLGALLLAI